MCKREFPKAKEALTKAKNEYQKRQNDRMVVYNQLIAREINRNSDAAIQREAVRLLLCADMRELVRTRFSCAPGDMQRVCTPFVFRENAMINLLLYLDGKLTAALRRMNEASQLANTFYLYWCRAYDFGKLATPITPDRMMAYEWALIESHIDNDQLFARRDDPGSIRDISECIATRVNMVDTFGYSITAGSLAPYVAEYMSIWTQGPKLSWQMLPTDEGWLYSMRVESAVKSDSDLDRWVELQLSREMTNLGVTALQVVMRTIPPEKKKHVLAESMWTLKSCAMTAVDWLTHFRMARNVIDENGQYLPCPATTIDYARCHTLAKQFVLGVFAFVCNMAIQYRPIDEAKILYLFPDAVLDPRFAKASDEFLAQVRVLPTMEQSVQLILAGKMPTITNKMIGYLDEAAGAYARCIVGVVAHNAEKVAWAKDVLICE